MEPVKIKMLSDKAIMPKRATECSVAYDVYVPEDTVVRKGRQVIPLQFAIELPDKYYEAKIEPRSGFSSKGMEGYEVIHKTEQNICPIERLKYEVSNAGYACLEPQRFDCDVLIGKIDSDFRNSVGVIVNNRDNKEFLIKAGTRIAQMTVYRTPEVSFFEVEELSSTDRKGGFGHTGTN